VYPDVRAVVARVRQSVVAIDVTVITHDPRGRGMTSTASGTGIVLTSSGMIATNAHVVSGAQEITVTLPDGSKVEGTLVGVRTAEDLAVVYVDRSDLVAAEIGRSSDMQVGDFVVAIGNALALEGGPTASLGIVSALDRTITTNEGGTYSHLLQTDAAINSGDSGGPLVNAAGQVVGINAASALSAENIGFAIAIDVVLPLLIDIYTD
jgi:S1-C subfamily serine protease